MPALLALVAVTAVWGLRSSRSRTRSRSTRCSRSSRSASRSRRSSLAPFAGSRVRALGRRGAVAGRGRRRAAGAGLHAADARARADERLERRLRHRHVRRADAAARARLLPDPVGGRRGSASGSRPPGSALLAGVHAGSLGGQPARPRRRGRLLAADRAARALRAPLRRARASRSSSCSRPSPCSPSSRVPTLASSARLDGVGALLVTGVFASALGFLVQTWAQQRTSATRTALVFTLEPAFAALFGFTLAGDRLGCARLDRLSRDHVRDRPRRAGGRARSSGSSARRAA